MKNVDIYTDGACSGNPGRGGWGAVLIYNGTEKEMSGGDPDTTNNRMEVTAAIKGLSALKEKCAVRLFSDSAYLVNAVEKGWLAGWRRGRWTTADGKPVKNRDLWEALSELIAYHEVTFVKVKGHADNVNNNRCDALARAAITALPK